MLTSSYASEEDHFRQRLDSINKEMQDIIARTAMERDRLYRNSAIASLPWSITDATPTEATDPGSLFNAPLTNSPSPLCAPSSGVLDEAAVRRIVADEMKSWKVVFQTMLTGVTKGVNDTINQRLEDVNKSHLELSESLKEATEVSARGLGEMQSAFKRLQRGAKLPVEDLSREMEEHFKNITAEQNHLRDAVSTLQNEARIEQQRQDRRVDELVRRHHDLVRTSLLELDSHVTGLRDELEQMVRSQTRKATEECDEMHQHVARLHGALEATNDTTTRWVAELRQLMEENMSFRSEVRSCRSDFNRLEMLLHGVSATSPDAGAISGVTGTPPRGESGRATCGLEVYHGDVLKLKEQVNLLQGRMDKMDRQMASMNEALHRLFAGAGGESGGVSYVPNASQPGTTGVGKNHQEPLDLRRGAMSTSLQPTHDASSLSLQEFQQRQQQLLLHKEKPYLQQQQQMARTHGQRGMSSTAGTGGDLPRGGGRSPPRLVPSPSTSAELLEAQHANYGPGLHHHHHHQHQHDQQRPQSSQQVARYSHVLSSPGVMGHTMEHSDSPPVGPSERSAGVQQPPPQASPDDFNTTLMCRDMLKSTPVARESETSFKCASPSDSYVSDDDEKAKKEVSSMQYLPAPSSDVESEIANKKMARLALD
ncbi:hypothetical protein TraAM80_03077 [Trypanosoma rangeli]|uniref:Uncharacterized protein n=1 Tax=Trypanosoma rangeli TaxID=5698 RepID=A0A3R7KJV3_TRYRA|nr:uncharacterized protein TraAM80_03077 [Trypanosoma rangeli]RNF07929.1 hypothetical protein TraAM80_03077 [Trypanosoma rangeli]|eukprot:RNF07929.1 hypothetical protein TraAM80_03077 [Trypanosoma rangeli]